MANGKSPLDTAGQSLMDLISGLAQAPGQIAGGYLDVLSGGIASQGRNSPVAQSTDGAVPQAPLDLQGALDSFTQGVGQLPGDVSNAFDVLMGRVSSPSQAQTGQRDINAVFLGQDPPSASPTEDALQRLMRASGSGTQSFVARGDDVRSNGNPAGPSSGGGSFSRSSPDASSNFMANYGLLSSAIETARAKEMDTLFTKTAADIAQMGGTPSEISRKLLTLAKVTGKPASAISSILNSVDGEVKTQDDIRQLFLEMWQQRKPGETLQQIQAKALQKFQSGE